MSHSTFFFGGQVQWIFIYLFIYFFGGQNFTPWRPKKNPLPKRVISKKNKFQNLPYFEGKKKKKKKSEVAIFSRHI